MPKGIHRAPIASRKKMGTSDYKKLKNDQQNAQKEREAFRFRCIPSGRKFLYALIAAAASGGLTLLFQHVFRSQPAAIALFVLFCGSVFVLAVMCLLWCSTTAFYLLHREKLKRNIKKLEKKEQKEQQLFESSYFKPISEEEENDRHQAS